MAAGQHSTEAEPASAGVVEVAGLEAIGPVAFVVFRGEVAGAGAGEEGVPDAGGVLLVAGAPGSGRDVHDVAPADAVRVQRVPAGVEPPHPAGLVLPEAVQERLHPRHPVTLPGLHLGGRPVDGVDLGPGADAAEEVIAGAAVVLEDLLPST